MWTSISDIILGDVGPGLSRYKTKMRLIFFSVTCKFMISDHHVLDL